MTPEEIREKKFRISMDLNRIGMLLPDKTLKDCKEYFDRLGENIAAIFKELDDHIAKEAENDT